MPDEIPAPSVHNGIIASTSVTYTESTMVVRHKINVWGYLGTIVVAIAVFALLNQFHDGTSCLTGFLISAVILFFAVRERSYRYEFDKERKEVRCKWGGFLGIFVDKPTEITCPLNDAVYIRVQQIPRPGYYTLDYFKIKVVFPNGKELELPSGHSLAECMKYATAYKDFLELSIPIKLPGSGL